MLTYPRLAGDAPQGWKTPYVIVLLILGILLIGAFIYWQSVCATPLMPLYVWRDRNFSLVSILFRPPLIHSCRLTRAFLADGCPLSRFHGIRLRPVLDGAIHATSPELQWPWYHGSLIAHGSWWSDRQYHLCIDIAPSQQ